MEDSNNTHSTLEDSDAFKAGQTLGYNIIASAEINHQYEILSSTYLLTSHAKTDTSVVQHGFLSY